MYFPHRLTEHRDFIFEVTQSYLRLIYHKIFGLSLLLPLVLFRIANGITLYIENSKFVGIITIDFVKIMCGNAGIMYKYHIS